MGVLKRQSTSISNYEKAAQIIMAGGIVAYPTETSYGLAVDPFSERALKRLFSVKKRSQNKAFSVLAGNKEHLLLLAQDIPPQYSPLMEMFWPGPLTLIFKANKKLPAILTAEDETVGVRISSHPVAMKLVEAVSRPITATSANISGQAAAESSDEVYEQFGDAIDMILIDDSGLQGQWSTVVKLDGDQLKLVRPGIIPFHEIQRVAGMKP